MFDQPILALDQSLERTGFALFDGHKVAISGSWPLCDGAKHRDLGFRELWHRMDAIHKGHRIGQIIHEGPVFGAANKGEDHLIGSIGLIAVIELFCISRGLPKPRSHSPSSWRVSWFTKSERKIIRAKSQKLRDWKHPAILRARQYGFDPSSHDEAEAIGILDHDLLKQRIMPPWRSATMELESIA